MEFPGTLDQPEARAKLAVQRRLIVTNHIKAAAFGRTLRAEAADDDVPSRFRRACDILDLRSAGFRLRQEVKDGAIMPHIVPLRREDRLCNVGPHPVHGGTCLAESYARSIQRSLRDV